MKRYAYCMYNPLRYIDPSGWALREPGNSPDDPPRLNNYRPGTYYSADPEYAWLVRLDEVEVSATSLDHDINNKGTNYTEGTQWSNNEQYTYLGTTHNTGPTLGSGGFGGGTIITTPNNQWGNSKLTPSVVNYPTAVAGTLISYNDYFYNKRATAEEIKQLGERIRPRLKKTTSPLAKKSTMVIGEKACKNLRVASKVVGVGGLLIEGAEVYVSREIKPSNFLDFGISTACILATGPAGWIIGGTYLVADIISYSYTGRSLGGNIDHYLFDNQSIKLPF